MVKTPRPVGQDEDAPAVVLRRGGTALQLFGYTKVPEPELPALWALYLRAFSGLARRAASRHVMDRDQFHAEMADLRITKFVVFSDARPVGLLTITANLDDIVWVSPDFYRNRYPRKAQAGKLYYVTNMLTDPGYHGREVFLLLTEAAYRLAAGGVLGFDVCSSNVRRGFPAALHRQVSQLHNGACAFEELDSQTFYGIDLTDRSG